MLNFLGVPKGKLQEVVVTASIHVSKTTSSFRKDEISCNEFKTEASTLETPSTLRY